MFTSSAPSTGSFPHVVRGRGAWSRELNTVLTRLRLHILFSLFSQSVRFYSIWILIDKNVYLQFKGKVHSKIEFLSFSQPNISLWSVYAVFPRTVRMRATKKSNYMYVCLYVFMYVLYIYKIEI